MKISRFLAVLITLGLFLSSAPRVGLAQQPQPPAPVTPGEKPQGMRFDAQTNMWVSSGAGLQPARATLSSTSSPDGFGYYWDDSVPLAWVDATPGVQAGMSGYTDGQKTGPISLPFAFKYYENSYTSLFIAGSGYLGFSDQGSWRWQPHVPSSYLPNNIIAPYAAPLQLASSGIANRIFYGSGGVAPNRYFVVEWYQVKMNDDTFTFEVILYENGDILFQYQQMTYVNGWACGSIGIEDSLGEDGLAYIDYCRAAPSNKAVRFYRPAPAVRLQLLRAYQGAFTTPGLSSTFTMTVRNTGEFGSDTYNVSASSAWPMFVQDDASGSALVDTNADGMIDTGSLAPGAQKVIRVTVQAPAIGNVGDNNTATLVFASTLNPAVYKQASLRTAIPAPFAQFFEDDGDGAMSLSLVQPDQWADVKTTPDRYYGSDMASIEKPDGFAYFWDKYNYVNNRSYSDLEFTFLDKAGNTTKAVTKLTSNSSAYPTVEARDWNPVLALAPNGRIGVAWVRYLWNPANNQELYNVYFAVLDPAGNLVYGPVNLSNNPTWKVYGDQYFTWISYPKIAATGDNRFSISWQREYWVTAGYALDLFHTVRDSSGGTVKAVTQLTSDAPGWDQYYEQPSLTPLSGNRVLMTWIQADGTYLSVYDSAGTALYGPAYFQGYYFQSSDAVQLSGGSILIAGSSWYSNYPATLYTVLDGNNYVVLKQPTFLPNPSAPRGDWYVSATADQSNHAILTWMDNDYDLRRNLYYALVDGSGNVLTPPMIFHSSKSAIDAYIETSYSGMGNTSYTLAPPTDPYVDLKTSGSVLAGGTPGGTALVPLKIQNQGSVTATSVTLTATLDSRLTYLGASPSASVSGNVVTWILPSLGYRGIANITLQVGLPSNGIGTSYPITFQVVSTQPDATPADNTFTAQAMESLQFFLPAVMK